MPYVGLKFAIIGQNSYLATPLSLNFHLPIVIIRKTIMQIKIVIIDNIYNINFIKFNIITLFFFSICPAKNWLLLGLLRFMAYQPL